MPDLLQRGWEALTSIPGLGLALVLGWLAYLLLLGGWIVLQKREPVATLSWLLGLALLPYVGFLVYHVFGPQKIHRHRLRRQTSRARMAGDADYTGETTDTAELTRLAEYRLEQVTQHPVTPAPDVLPVDAREWADRHLEAYGYLSEPFSDMSGMAGPMAQLAPAMVGMQVGSLVGGLARPGSSAHCPAGPPPTIMTTSAGGAHGTGRHGGGRLRGGQPDRRGTAGGDAHAPGRGGPAVRVAGDERATDGEHGADLRGQVLADPGQVLVGEVLHAGGAVDARGLESLLGRRTTDAVDVTDAVSVANGAVSAGVITLLGVSNVVPSRLSSSIGSSVAFGAQLAKASANSRARNVMVASLI